MTKDAAARPRGACSVALIRGINVGRAKRVGMADLRDIVSGLGYQDVRTVLNSGNVVFRAAPGVRGNPAPRIEQASPIASDSRRASRS